jgi:hypothetical protein
MIVKPGIGGTRASTLTVSVLESVELYTNELPEVCPFKLKRTKRERGSDLLSGQPR